MIKASFKQVASPFLSIFVFRWIPFVNEIVVPNGGDVQLRLAYVAGADRLEKVKKSEKEYIR